MRDKLRHFRGSLFVTVLGLGLGAVLGWQKQASLASVGATVFVVAVLGVLEISLSFDNAVVNATVLRTMTAVWRRRFITWGILIAVFGMRLVFPLLVVSSVARVSPVEALRLAISHPTEYARILGSAHYLLGAFGGAFLGLVSLRFFFDVEKDVHWIAAIEKRVAGLGRVRAIEIGVVLTTLLGFSKAVPPSEQNGYLIAGILGIIVHIGVDGLGGFLEASSQELRLATSSGLSAFIYLEVLDASFSFDGVVGAFAITNDLFVIAVGLGVGAMFVRSLTVLLVEEETFEAFRYLEHGAFWAIGALAMLMLVGTVIEVPEFVTALIGAAFIGLSLWSSVRDRVREAAHEKKRPE